MRYVHVQSNCSRSSSNPEVYGSLRAALQCHGDGDNVHTDTQPAHWVVQGSEQYAVCSARTYGFASARMDTGEKVIPQSQFYCKFDYLPPFPTGAFTTLILAESPMGCDGCTFVLRKASDC